MKFTRTRTAFYTLLEIVFMLVWLPFLAIERLLFQPMVWAYKKKRAIWTRLAAEAIAHNSREIKKG